MNILITGASGFIGEYLIRELLEKGYKIKALTRNTKVSNNKIETINGDITKPETLNHALKNIDAVFHNAAFAMDWGKKNDFYTINVIGTKNVAQACEKNNVKRLIYTSSAGVYGFPKTSNQIDEDYQKQPLNDYQNSKLLGEIELEKFNDLHVSAIRPPLVLGPKSYAVKVIIDKLKVGKLPLFFAILAIIFMSIPLLFLFL